MSCISYFCYCFTFEMDNDLIKLMMVHILHKAMTWSGIFWGLYLLSSVLHEQRQWYERERERERERAWTLVMKKQYYKTDLPSQIHINAIWKNLWIGWELFVSKDHILLIKAGTFEIWFFMRHGEGRLCLTRENCVDHNQASHRVNPMTSHDRPWDDRLLCNIWTKDLHCERLLLSNGRERQDRRLNCNGNRGGHVASDGVGRVW